MAKTDMENLRGHLQLRHLKQIRLIVDSPEGSDAWNAMFECVNCIDLFEWLPDKGWWQCPGCTYELTPKEAVLLVRRSKDAVVGLLKDVRTKTGGRWAWMWPFGRG